MLRRRFHRAAHRLVMKLTGGTVVRVQTSEPALALTFDDGPDPVGTPELLKILRKHGAKATFFMVGASAVRHRDVVEEVSRAGHVIGNHTWDHR